MLRRILLAACLASGVTAAQGATPWRDLSPEDLALAKTAGESWIQPAQFRAVALDGEALALALESAKVGGTVTLDLPRPDGGRETFVLEPVRVMAAELEAWMASAGYPMQTLQGRSVSNPSATVRIDFGGPTGFHASVLGTGDAWYIDPMVRGDSRHYASYFKRNSRSAEKRWQCGFQPANVEQPKGSTSTGGALRTFRLAVAATGEYTGFHGGSVVGAQAAIVTTINRVNQVYERDVSIRMVVIADNQELVYTDGATDPYTNDDGDAMLDENQANVDAVVGFANYDIGHVFSTGGGGVAGFGVVCGGRKAEGVTGSSQPVGDPFDVDFVAHELGHQWRGDHTFNSVAGSCMGNRSSTTAFEPGSGTTIMAYAGICEADNIQPNSDAYFHAVSLDEILNFSASVSCGTTSAVVNGAEPQVAFGTADGLTLPAATPFELTLQPVGMPEANESYTYTVEQFDLGPPASLADGDSARGPILRSRPPAATPGRTFPMPGASDTGETLPTTTRDLNFRATVRDLNPSGGRVGEASLQLSVTAEAGPFAVIAPNGGETLASASEVTWDVAGTTGNGVDTQTVDILLSTDSGQSYREVLSASTPNDGSELVVLPAVATGAARIRIRGVEHVFFDDSDDDFAIGLSSNCASPAIPIPDAPAGAITDDIMIDDDEVIVDLDISVGIAHTYRGDLNLSLTHVDTGRTVALTRDDDRCGGDNLEVNFDDEAGPTIVGECDDNLSGRFRPVEALSAFDREVFGGTWRLTVEDIFPGDIGSLNSWCLTAQTQPAPPDVTVAPTVIDFGESAVGNAAPTQTFSITNNTALPIAFTIFHASGSASEFPIVGTTGNNPLGGGETTEFEIGFVPEVEGGRRASLAFTTANAELASITVNLSGRTSERIFDDGFETR